MTVSEYREVLQEDILLAAKANHSDEEYEFMLYSVGVLSNAEEFDDFIDCNFEGLTRENNQMRIDGYSVDETDGSCCIFIADYRGSEGDDLIRPDSIEALFIKSRMFVEESVRYELYQELDDDGQAMEFSRDLFFDSDKITKYRFYLLTDAYCSQGLKTTKGDDIFGKSVALNVWDVERLYELVRSATHKESVEIVLSDLGCSGIPCVKAVDYKDVVADIDVVPSYDQQEDEATSDNIVTYSSYLAVVPGQLLNDLYLEYGAKLLEGNVRSFLSARGKVNKSIQSTIKNYPEMFFAYNNGIAATASEINTKMTSKGLEITRIKDLQIVNGGQTTASIANTLLTAKKGETIDLSRLFVPMKLSVLEHSMSERIIPKISEYSNSQNKVDASDFFSNHPFHFRMEGYSRKTAVPRDDEQLQQFWFYERTRGQYNQEKMKFSAKSDLLKQYKTKYPENMVITMLDLARYMELYECAPHVVSKGKQKTLQVFAEEIKKTWQKSDEIYNAYYYRRMVAIAILYRSTDELVKQTGWYKEKRSYKANVIAYTLSIIFNYIKTYKKGYELDFNRIWNMQSLYDELEDQINVLIGEVYKFITGPRDTENVTEWCKKESCWLKAKSQAWTINDPFVYSLISVEEVNREAKEEKDSQKIANELDMLKEIFARGPKYWREMLDWGNENRLLTEKEESILQLIINMNVTGRIPTDKQAKVVMQARDRLIKEGMPLQF